MHLARELLMNIQCCGGSRSYAKETRALKMRSLVAIHWKSTETNWEQSLKLILLQLHEKFPKNSTSIILRSFCTLNKLDRWKNWISGCLTSWPKKIFFKLLLCTIVFTYSTKQQTISQLGCDIWRKVDLVWQPAQWVDWEEAPKHFPKSILHQKKVMVTGGLLSIWSTTTFYIPAKPSHLRSILSKWMRCTKNCNTCSPYWSTERAQFFSRTTPDCGLHS